MTTTTTATRMLVSLVLFLTMVTLTMGFAPQRTTTTVSSLIVKPTFATRSLPLFMGFNVDKDRDKLTRDSEPEDFFRTNTDKMTDQEKIPIAVAGIAFIALPFIAGLIALYASK